MKNKIKEVHDYFRNKLIKGEFKVKGIQKHHILLIIDNEYLFVIWSANEDFGIKTSDCLIFKPTQKNVYSFIDINFRVKDKESLWRKIKPIIKEHNDTIILKEKKQQFESLKKELKL